PWLNGRRSVRLLAFVLAAPGFHNAAAREAHMKKSAFIAAVFCLPLMFTTPASAQASGTGPEAKAMLEKAVAALKADEKAALANFNKPDGGFKDRDLYVFCFNASDGKITAHPSL